MTQAIDELLQGPEEVTDAAGVEAICRFRVEVWRAVGLLAPDAFPDGTWRDPIDATARHWVVRDARGALVGAARLSVHATLGEVHQAEEYLDHGLDLAGPVANPDRVVVSPALQGRGVGTLLLDVQDAAARAAGARFAVRQASRQMWRLLRARGWRAVAPARPDPRFPGAEFTVVYLDLAAGLA